MKYASIILGFLFLYSPFVSGQSSVWKVEGKGTSLYMGGTVHFLRAEDYPLPAEFDSAYSHSNALVFETDLEKLEDPSLAMELMKMATYTDETTLKSVLDEEVYALLEEECKKLGMPIANLNKFKPGMAVLTLSMMEMQKMGMSQEGVDMHFYKQTIKDEKSIFHLESVEKQLNLLVNMGEGKENEFVRYSLMESEKMEKELEKIITAWKSGDAKGMEEEAETMKTEFPDLYKAMLTERNNSWLPQIETFLETETVEYILVGALHVHGTDGLIQLLEGKGYKVSQAKF